VGGGVIGCEFAFILKALGARVTLVEGLSRLLPLPSVDEDCSKVLQREMKKQKIAFLLHRTLEGVDREGDRVRAVIGPSPFAGEPKESEKKSQTIVVDRVLVCIGRTPNTSEIGLGALGIRLDGKGWIPVDEQMKTNVPNVYAVGDVLGPDKIMLAHVASTEGLVAADNAGGGNRSMDYRVVPGAVFTMPEVADVGLTEAQARQLGLTIRSDTVLFRNVGKAQVIGEIAGQVKIVSDADKGTILGVHMVGPHVTDLIAEGALAVQSQATTKDLAETIHAHPTLAEIMLEVSLKATDQALHG
jgi:dihydrolipoamide dehydrogenase